MMSFAQKPGCRDLNESVAYPMDLRDLDEKRFRFDMVSRSRSVEKNQKLVVETGRFNQEIHRKSSTNKPFLLSNVGKTMPCLPSPRKITMNV